MSEAWIAMAQTLGRVASITEMESKLPRASSRQTLWEGEEQALRYVIEDGKLNICLRNLVDFKAYEMKLRSDGVEPEQRQKDLMDKFEKGMGCMLRNAWNHVEALQTTDLPALVNHITTVFSDAADSPERVAQLTDITTRQEVLCMYYLHGMVGQMEEMSEERVMPMLRAAGTLVALARMLSSCHAALGRDARELGTVCLGLACGTEDFATYRDKHVPPADRGVFVALRDAYLLDMCQDPDAKRRARPLLDFTSFCVRTARK
eukprot:TRINITY_DN4333_c0_g1_i1.p1 TRINITY_DN4333_c0_g1~~TRINITY_DN4333_c0_g1_i1.p1  ORF type:complete len:262 (+),score=85.76 TRINITY_DN4333_c0_g1_i1:250-1035(+)